jgi:hypothetical protein
VIPFDFFENLLDKIYQEEGEDIIKTIDVNGISFMLDETCEGQCAYCDSPESPFYAELIYGDPGDVDCCICGKCLEKMKQGQELSRS